MKGQSCLGGTYSGEDRIWLMVAHVDENGQKSGRRNISTALGDELWIRQLLILRRDLYFLGLQALFETDSQGGKGWLEGLQMEGLR